MIEVFRHPTTGEVVVAKKQGAIWGTKEQPHVTTLLDPRVEAMLATKSAVYYPYKGGMEPIQPVQPKPSLIRRMIGKVASLWR